MPPPAGCSTNDTDNRLATLNLYYSPDYVGSAYSFETTRKAKWVADSLVASPIEGIELVRPQALTSDQVLQVHDREYVRAVETGGHRYLAESQGFTWDPGLWPMVLASNGGARLKLSANSLTQQVMCYLERP